MGPWNYKTEYVPKVRSNKEKCCDCYKVFLIYSFFQKVTFCQEVANYYISQERNVIGYFLAKCDFLEKRIDRKYLITITALLFIGSYLWYIFCFVVPRSHLVHQFVRLSYFNLLILFMSANAFLLFKYLSKTKSFIDMENNRLGNAFTTISNYSYGIYLIHYLVLYCIKINLIKFINFTQGSSLIWIPVLVIITTAISLAILSILDKIPYLDKVTGKK